ncbi:tetraacyldisaccharide 4'-kinase [Roseivirga sp. BDSF3-8]|uniref:tetraacyldisaccharide 4'-kinase n=1 Tax=Roseivirga sp. BDSF3-8 TaxID=3241598 RepID=UPI003531AC64
MGLSRIVLSPFSALYKVVTDVRNFLYDQGRRHSTLFTVPVINVGNLTVGGTGKSPMIEYLGAMLSESYQVAILSRGYGRRTKGFRLAGEGDDATTLGDEPYQFYQKAGDNVTVAVGEERALAIPSILLERPETNVILLDDAFQHRAVVPHFNILLSDYNRPFYKDMVLPAGRLRESRYGARRAHAVIVTKCPGSLDEKAMELVKAQIEKYTRAGTPVFFTTISYGQPISLYGHTSPARGENVVAFSGIARSEPFINYLAKTYALSDHMDFPDHHAYSESDLERIKARFMAHGATSEQTSLVTTEKDAARLRSLGAKHPLSGLPVSYIPIRPVFLRDEEVFRSMVFDAVSKELGR